MRAVEAVVDAVVREAVVEAVRVAVREAVREGCWVSVRVRTIRQSSEPTLSSDGKERTIVTMRSRSCLAPLSSRMMRRMRRMRMTRSSMGGMGRYAASSSEANWSSRDVQTRKKSKRHQLSEK